MLDGIQACYDHNFIRDGNALAPLMNVFHAKKIGPEIIREAIMAVSDFCDPPKADVGVSEICTQFDALYRICGSCVCVCDRKIFTKPTPRRSSRKKKRDCMFH